MAVVLKRNTPGIFPGTGLCLAVTLAAYALEALEKLIFGRAWLESLVLAILLGSAVRTFWEPDERFAAGIQFSAKTVLEVAVVLLGASVSASQVLARGPALIAGIAAVVTLSLCASYGVGRGLGLSHRLAVLVACGNSICGNSAIAAAAPVIGAGSKDIAASIAFTAVLGVVVVLALPLTVPLLGFSTLQYGVFAGLTVYAVPQVLAATAQVSFSSVQVGTLVKLVRVLMLGPVILVLALSGAKRGHGGSVASGSGTNLRRPSFFQLVPWFIIGFLLLMALRSAGAIPAFMLAPAQSLATLLTIISMAALGLGVDVRAVARAGLRVTSAAALSLVMLGCLSFALIRLLGIA